MTDRDIGMEILERIKEIKRHKSGDVQLKSTTLANPSPAQIIRKKLELSQASLVVALHGWQLKSTLLI
ncbi:putative transcriptional regulator [Bathymodiolus platifrons methanotrophic gill symbiont]|uniref:hypothetical protein n=1 Tax=unclassified Gammaproteobacteria TaxID=33811 RepID=UPI001B5E8B1D|nr:MULTISPECIES: hypothetical protein [unclassified Gammaproteobacteria]GFO77353.1 putative transcriptional regulator [Bathymodiolus platifrons methanotrophic gill symbiont]